MGVDEKGLSRRSGITSADVDETGFSNTISSEKCWHKVLYKRT